MLLKKVFCLRKSSILPMSKVAQVQALTKAPISSLASTAFSRDSPNQACEAPMEEWSNWHHVTSVTPKLDIYKSSMKSCAPHIEIILFNLPQKPPQKNRLAKSSLAPCHASCARWSNMYLVFGSNCSNSCGCAQDRINMPVIAGSWRPCWNLSEPRTNDLRSQCHLWYLCFCRVHLFFTDEIWWYTYTLFHEMVAWTAHVVRAVWDGWYFLVGKQPGHDMFWVLRTNYSETAV